MRIPPRSEERRTKPWSRPMASDACLTSCQSIPSCNVSGCFFTDNAIIIFLFTILFNMQIEDLTWYFVSQKSILKPIYLTKNKNLIWMFLYLKKTVCPSLDGCVPYLYIVSNRREALTWNSTNATGDPPLLCILSRLKPWKLKTESRHVV